MIFICRQSIGGYHYVCQSIRILWSVRKMSNNKNIYTTIQVRRDFNGHIKEFCKKYGVNASKITELMWVNYISSSIYLKEVMSMAEPARSLLLSASMSGSITV
jgi:hypothetical protein